MAAIENFVFSKGINYTYIAPSKNKFVMSDSPIVVSFSKYDKTLCFLYKNKKASYGSFHEDKWFLDSSTSTYFTLFESDFVDMTPDNYS